MPRVWTKEEKQRMRETQLARVAREKRIVTVPEPPKSGVQFHCSVKVDMQEMTGMSPAQLHAFMYGIAHVIASGKSD